LKYVITEYVWWTGSIAATMSNQSNTVKGIATASMKTSTSQNIIYMSRWPRGLILPFFWDYQQGHQCEKMLTLIYCASVCLTDGSSVVHAWWGYTTLIYIMSYAGVILLKYLYLNLLLHQNHNTILVMMLSKNNTIYW